MEIDSVAGANEGWVIPPGVGMIAASLLLLLLPRSARRLRFCVSLLAPLASAAHLWLAFPEGTLVTASWLQQTLVLVRADRLALLWGGLFHVATFLGVLYSVQDARRETVALGLAYAGSATAAVFAGDWITLFICWELTAVTSAGLVWLGGQVDSRFAAIRYLLLQVLSGVLMLSGVLWIIAQGDPQRLIFAGLTEVGALTSQVEQWPERLLLLAIAIKAAFPFVHVWLVDGYPQSDSSGAVFLSAFTTKLAVYVLLRAFAGWSPLVAIGAVMAIVPLVYASVEDDLRRCLSYCLINQLGFMVAAIGVGSELAINGVAAHAVAHVLYKSLLFMVAGVILDRYGHVRMSRLGGLGSEVRFVFLVYLAGVAAIGAPGFSGFVTKSLSLNAIAKAHHEWAWLALIAATTGVFWVCGLRVTYLVFLRESADRSELGRESGGAAPMGSVTTTRNLAMGLAAVFGVMIGLFPAVLYRCLPTVEVSRPYTVAHVVDQLEILAAAVVGWVLVYGCRAVPNLSGRAVRDVDALYCGPVFRTLRWCGDMAERAGSQVAAQVGQRFRLLRSHLHRLLADDGRLGPMTSTGVLAMWAAVMLVFYLLVYYR